MQASWDSATHGSTEPEPKPPPSQPPLVGLGLLARPRELSGLSDLIIVVVDVIRSDFLVTNVPGSCGVLLRAWSEHYVDGHDRTTPPALWGLEELPRPTTSLRAPTAL